MFNTPSGNPDLNRVRDYNRELSLLSGVQGRELGQDETMKPRPLIGQYGFLLCAARDVQTLDALISQISIDKRVSGDQKVVLMAQAQELARIVPPRA
jgi:hypothetical protein